MTTRPLTSRRSTIPEPRALRAGTSRPARCWLSRRFTGASIRECRPGREDSSLQFEAGHVEKTPMQRGYPANEHGVSDGSFHLPHALFDLPARLRHRKRTTIGLKTVCARSL
jgi:hypothetical protein